MEFKNLNEWSKWLEKNFSPEIMIPTLPVIIRLDGNNFAKWTKTLEKPFDLNFTQLMIETTKYLVKETGAIIGYTQSDEITLILYSADKKSLIFNNGKKQKILSKLTGLCVNYFNDNRKKLLPNHNKLANFDCRIYQVPTLKDACNQLLWRELDAMTNSVQMLGQYYFSHNELFKLNINEIKNKLLNEYEINWNFLPRELKRGTYIKKQKEMISFTKDEILNLPNKHAAKTNHNLIIERNKIIIADFPELSTILNIEDVIFNNTKPIIK